MTDRDIVKKCAERMGFVIVNHGVWGERITDGHSNELKYDPLNDDAQAMALVKKFGIQLSVDADWIWTAIIVAERRMAINENLNRAICECVARMT